METRLKRFRNNFISGVLVLVPFAAIVWLTVFVISVLGGVRHFLPSAIRNSENQIVKFLVSLGVLVMILLVITFVGWLSRRFIGKQIQAFFDEAVVRVPVIGTIYSAIKQLIDLFSNKNNQFKSVCMVEFPRKGVRSLAFVTGETILGGEKHFTVFVPTTPNPTSGFTLFLKKDELICVDMSIEAAFKTIVSMGVLTPSNNNECRNDF